MKDSFVYYALKYIMRSADYRNKHRLLAQQLLNVFGKNIIAVNHYPPSTLVKEYLNLNPCNSL